MSAPICGFCGNPATGLASINGRRYCHGDDDADPTCYELEQWKRAGIEPDVAIVENYWRGLYESEHE